jgi:hypothetical protein
MNDRQQQQQQHREGNQHDSSSSSSFASISEDSCYPGPSSLPAELFRLDCLSEHPASHLATLQKLLRHLRVLGRGFIFVEVS